ncbi:S-type pyocin domain-containing protein [Pseudomonas sp. NFX1]|uniref:S-type pyocin domain-containing protein n=1 Tax=Pseudomonas sp. NFX1 TaxID=2201355 RepID=UPI003DA72C44
MVEAERIAAKAAAKAEAERIAAEAAAKAEAERIAAETELIRLANTYSASGSVAVTGSVIITAVGTVVSTSAEYLLRGVIGAAVGAVSGFTASVGAGFVVGVSALFYSPNLGNGELPRRYSLQTPLSDLDPQLSVQLAASAAASASYIDLPYRFSSQLNANDDSEIFAVKTGGEVVPSQVRILTASYDTQRNVYTATTADVPPRTLTWTPIVTPGDSSTGLPADQRDTPIYKGATLKPIEIRIDSYPGVADASWDDYVIIFPADSGLPPIYTMFRDRREEMGTASGLGVEVDDHWATSVETRKGAPIPRQISDLLRGQQFRNWRAYREALWKAVSSDAFLAAQFDPVSIGRMRKGFAPFARLHERVGALASLQIHHKTPISEGGDVYNSENIVIVTPKQHINIHHGEIE